MKLVFSGIAVLTLFFIPFTLAKAETCSGRADGNVWPASRGPVDGR